MLACLNIQNFYAFYSYIIAVMFWLFYSGYPVFVLCINRHIAMFNVYDFNLCIVTMCWVRDDLINEFNQSVIVFFLYKIGMRKYPWNVCSGTVFLKDTLIEIKGKFTQCWFALNIFYRRLKWKISVSNDSRRNEFKEKCWMMSFTYPCDVSDDIMSGRVKISTCDMLSKFLCIRFILNRRLLLKP